MRKIIIKDLDKIANEISERCRDNDVGIAVIGYYETIVELFNVLIKTTDSEFIAGELHPHDYDGYDDAYYIEYDNNEIWIGKVRYDGSNDYVKFSEGIVYVEEDFLKDFLKSNDVDNVVVFGFLDVHDEIDKEYNSNTCLCMNDDDTGFTFCAENEFGHSKFKYKGNKKLTEDEAWEIVNKYFE